MTVPLFSIIIPTYNSAKTLHACFDSILNQSFQDFEILIVDGASSDETILIAKQYAALYPKIHWTSKKDKGVYDAMNKGIEAAKGEWLYFLGSDDKLYDSEVLHKIAETITGDNTMHVVYGNVFSTRFNGIYDGEFTNQKILNQNICHQAIFFKKAVFKKTETFNVRYSSHADWDHNLKWFLSKKIRKKYVDILIAEYADGGMSSIQGDTLFDKEKQFNYLLYGHKHLSFNYKCFLLKKEFMKGIREKKLGRVSSIIFHAPYILF